MMEAAFARHRAIGSDATLLVVVAYRHVAIAETVHGPRRQIDARRCALADGVAVRIVDRDTFEIAATGELLRRPG